ncbi:hypothetical protein HYALB_00003486 [Hymenoscyphus albidus]|uniref:Indole-diterpene biosynthesis protein PaxU n=1 Tax=Hymenoscyphus albidus TaxID=595503 RepID=A0A9N9Q264_9HELO|nr:hypothetical protein HYALB_00003486 [Hymenoscyphus albidus]
MASHSYKSALATEHTYTQLSNSVSFYRPNGLSETNTDSPKLILLATWMDAANAHIGKYIVRYQALYPNAHILLVKSCFPYYFSPSRARRDLMPATHVIRDVLDPEKIGGSSDKSKTPSMLIHVFSNGGSCMVYHLDDLYAENYQDRLLPWHTTIFDSVPGSWTYPGGKDSVLVGLPSGIVRTLAIPFLHLLGIFWFFKFKIFRIQELASVWAQAHSDTVRIRESRRAYFYSKEDKFVHFGTVEEHADNAEANGFVVEYRENFPNSGHVVHARSAPDWYWALCQSVWEASIDSVEDKKEN